jgi:CheY-like chemotaxis protein
MPLYRAKWAATPASLGYGIVSWASRGIGRALLYAGPRLARLSYSFIESVSEMLSEFTNGQKTILFADDVGPLQEFVSTLLTKVGYNLITANSGRDALQKAGDFNGIIHLLLSNVEIPGMTGIELAIQLGLRRPDTKVLLIAGLASGILVLNNGWQFLPKPFADGMFRDRIRDFLSEQAESDKQFVDA